MPTMLVSFSTPTSLRASRHAELWMFLSILGGFIPPGKFAQGELASLAACPKMAAGCQVFGSLGCKRWFQRE
jgi:hypothetical protein